jgi:LysR family transcriptional regulator, cyn operon transcriptional activator
MKLSQLRTFVSIADSGGFARGAARLRLTQSAASRQIAALETELDVALFDRIGRRVQLTSEGDDLLKRARRLLADADAFGDRARALRGAQSGMLRLSARPQVIETFLAPFLPRYLSDSPGVEIQLSESGRAQQIAQLDRGEIHLAVMAWGIERFESRLLYPIHALAVMSRDHPMKKDATLDIAKLSGEPVLILNRDFGVRSWFDAACDNARVTPRVILESGSPHMIIALARFGQGIAIVPSNVNTVPSGVCVRSLVQGGQCVGRWSMIAWNRERFLAPYARRFIDELVKEAKRAFPGRNLIRRAPPLHRPR